MTRHLGAAGSEGCPDSPKSGQSGRHRERCGSFHSVTVQLSWARSAGR